MMYIRKQNRFTEKQIYPYISLEDFRLDLLRSAGLYGKDRATGESGYNLAAVMLLGNDCKYINS